jgi:uncharacterized protein YqeY
LEFSEEEMSLKEQISAEMKQAMRDKDVPKLGTIRLLMAAMKQKEVDERIEITDAHIIAIVEKMIKQRKDSIAQFQLAAREDLVANETQEMKVLELYLPAQMSEEEVAVAVKNAVLESGATGPQDMGKVIGLLKPLLAGKADMGKVSGLVKAALQN